MPGPYEVCIDGLDVTAELSKSAVQDAACKLIRIGMFQGDGMGGCIGGLPPDAARFEPAGRAVKLDTLQY